MLWKTDPDNVQKKEKLGRLFSHFRREPSPLPTPVLAFSTLHELEPAWLGSSAADLGVLLTSGDEGENARQDPGSGQQMSSDQRAPVGKRWPPGQADSRTVAIIGAGRGRWPPAIQGHPLPNFCPARGLGCKVAAEWVL